MRRTTVALVVVANVVAAAALVHWYRGRSPDGWEALGPEARCRSAAELVRQSNPWPTECRWREPDEALRGQSFPPPAGEPPWDRPHIEIYVGRSETRAELAHTIVHEMGHMRHTRQAMFGPEWLHARGLPADTPPSVWTEDYAEVFATLYGPPVGGWRAPTIRPSPEALAALEAGFFRER